MPAFRTISPINNAVAFEAEYHDVVAMRGVVETARKAQAGWRAVPLSDRIAILQKAADHLFDRRDEIGAEITTQMGRPISYSPGELAGLKERCDAMLGIAPSALQDVKPPKLDGFNRWISREPLGTVAVIAPWNYPFLTSVNAIIPALAAGNCVILKHSVQTPLVARRYQVAFDAAGLPAGVFQHVFLDHDGAAELMQDEHVDYVAFTGSVAGGYAVNEAVQKKFIGAGLELGGKDPAYVRADADLETAIEGIADGAFFNSGQSCCGVERVYAHHTIFDQCVRGIVDFANKLKLGDPRQPETTMGPMVSARGADGVRKQIAEAIEKGAKAHLPIDDDWGNNYLKPQVLTNVTHHMAVMTEESFGPVVGIMSVADDTEAIKLMNDSKYGLTASIWSKDAEIALEIGDQLECGTVFLNRCDYLDPYLAWTGVKDSGRGCTLSMLGYEQLTRPKSYHFKLPEGN